MGVQFRGGERFQIGRGIWGLLQMAKILFKPVLKTVGKVVKSNSGKAIGNVLTASTTSGRKVAYERCGPVTESSVIYRMA